MCVPSPLGSCRKEKGKKEGGGGKRVRKGKGEGGEDEEEREEREERKEEGRRSREEREEKVKEKMVHQILQASSNFGPHYLAMDSYQTRPKLLHRKQPFTDTDSMSGDISFQVPFAKGWASC